MKPLTLRFPRRMTIDLPEPVRQGLEAIANRERHESDEQLVQVVLSRGIVAMLTNEAEADGRPAGGPRSAGLDSRSASRPWSKPWVKTDDHEDSELYIGFPITEDLRRKLNDYMADHQESDAESTYATLLDLGLRKTEEDPGALDPARVFEYVPQNESMKLKKAHRLLRVAEQLYTRAKRRCGT